MMQGILAADVDYVWPLAAPILQRAVRVADLEDLEDLKESLLKKERQLWMIGGDSFMVTEIQVTPKHKTAHIAYLAGKGALKWFREVEKIFTIWAKENGCDMLSLQGRKGWERVFPEAEKKFVLLSKRI
jgi:hypothetical protein